MINRRFFLKTLAAGSAGAFLPALPAYAADEVRLVILHTNDTHSRIDPFPMDGGRYQGLGGIARRAALIKQIRREARHVLLLDSGDIFQGTPYFNFFGGEVEFKAMSAMGYDASTLGNHDFDNGVDGLADMLPHAQFQFVSSNYDVGETRLAGHVKPYTVRDFGVVRVGIFGLGIDFDRLVLPQLHAGVQYSDPILAAQRTVAALREAGCHFIICLSHLGYRYTSDRPSDTALAALVPDIDLILGGHTHTFMNAPDVYENAQSGFTVVNQVGWGGVRLGRVDVVFRPNGQFDRFYSSAYPIDRRLDRA